MSLFLAILCLTLLFGSSLNCSIPRVEYEFLSLLFNSTNGSKWNVTKNERWYFPSSLNAPCAGNWEGITCYPYGSGHCMITAVKLSGLNLQGSLPNHLFPVLTNLTVLDLSANNLTGTIPRSIANLTSVSVLYLYDNLMNGTLPNELFSLISLTDLALGTNSFVGKL